MIRNSKRKVAIVHGMLSAGNGGSEARAMWAAEALKNDFAVSLITPGIIPLDRLNEAHNTSVSANEVRLCTLPIPRVLTRGRAPAALRGAFADRALGAFIGDYDILVSTYNVCNFNRPAIQCIADFSWDESLRRRFDPAPPGMRGRYCRAGFPRWFYLCLCQVIACRPARAGFSANDMILANSHWTAKKLEQYHGVAPRVIYPPVAGNFADAGDRRRGNDFVCIGRISPEKRIERMIRIIGAVRSLGHDVRLRIAGFLDSSPYTKMIGELVKRNSNWAFLEGRVVGRHKERLLSECCYGIHGREGEAFGIAVAEMAKAGCITFAPAEGGPAEILRHEALLYRNEDDAIKKIVAVLNRQSLRSELSGHLERQARQFSAEQFMSGFRSAVDDFLANSASQKRPQSAETSYSTI